VKLLLDENLSRRIIPALQTRFLGSTQVALVQLERSTDQALCRFADENGYVLVSKDDDFQHLIAARGYRPKLVKIALGNVRNEQVLTALLSAADQIEAALADPEIGVVVIDHVE
jgi:predicted nuclease of predicted toxin-antitoxin system